MVVDEKKGRFLAALKRTTGAVVDGIKKLANSAKERIDLETVFKNQAVKLQRLHSELVNLDPTIWGIFDRQEMTLTIRAADKLDKSDLLEYEHIQYRVQEVRPEIVRLPQQLVKEVQFLECRVAVLAQI